jgi:hypothetical protein
MLHHMLLIAQHLCKYENDDLFRDVVVLSLLFLDPKAKRKDFNKLFFPWLTRFLMTQPKNY